MIYIFVNMHGPPRLGLCHDGTKQVYVVFKRYVFITEMFSKACGAQPPSRIFFSIGPVFGTAHSHLFRVQGFRTLNTRASLSESNHGLAHRQNYLIAYRTLANRSNAISRDNEAQNAISEKEAVNPRIKSVLRSDFNITCVFPRS